MRSPPDRSPNARAQWDFSGRAEGPESEWRHRAKERTPNHLNRKDRKAHERIGNRRGTKERNATMRNRRHRSASQWSPKQGSVPMIAIRTPVWTKRPEPRGADHERASSERPRSACSSSAPQTRTKKRQPNGTLVRPIIGVFRPNKRNRVRSSLPRANNRPLQRVKLGTNGIYLAQEYDTYVEHHPVHTKRREDQADAMLRCARPRANARLRAR